MPTSSKRLTCAIAAILQCTSGCLDPGTSRRRILDMPAAAVLESSELEQSSEEWRAALAAL